MDSDIRKRLSAARKHLASTAPDPPPHTDRKSSRKKVRRYIRPILFAVIGGTLIVALFTGVLMRKDAPKKETSIIPQAIVRSVPFPIYYPDPTKLPQGYTLDQASFSATSQAVVYSVIYEKDKRIVFTVQAKPSESDLQTFYGNNIPLHNEFQTSSGVATVSSLNNQTFASLPTHDNAWLIITAPNDINPDAFKALLLAIRRN